MKAKKKKKIAEMTEQGIMVDTEQLYKLGPVAGAIAMFKDLLDLDTKEDKK